MTAIKTSELTGAALDWAVAKCLHGNLFLEPYSTDWALGGAIIEREEISVEHGRAEFKSMWIAYKLGTPHEDNPEGGTTPLIAAMRCYVASKLGNTVEIPDSLI